MKITGYDCFTGGVYNEYRYFRYEIEARLYIAIKRALGDTAELEETDE